MMSITIEINGEIIGTVSVRNIGTDYLKSPAESTYRIEAADGVCNLVRSRTLTHNRNEGPIVLAIKALQNVGMR